MEAVGEEKLLSILHEYWGYDSFRSIQPDIIRSILAGHDTLGLMPTGGGKSLTFQVPAMALDGVCIVITPLVALMKDQVQALRQRGIPACAIYSGQTQDEVSRHLDNCVLGGNKLLYVSPERLGSSLFQKKVSHMRVSLITVDEAHCISQWGHDFRPSYLEIRTLRAFVPEAPVLALTATATPRVVKDIQHSLQRTPEDAPFEVFKMSFQRDNLSYVVRQTEDKYGELLHILRSVPGSTIIYTRSRAGCSDRARDLGAAGETALYYHAGLPSFEKDERQRRWQEGEVRIIVATNAFGMGIDKADVRLVLHMDLPDSLEAYFQEAGRAGRDGRRAYAVMLYAKRDAATIRRRMPDIYPEKAYIRKVYDRLGYFFQIAIGAGRNARFAFDLGQFCRNYHYFPIPVVSALNILTRAGYIHFEENAEYASRLTFTVRRDELYRLHMVSENEDKVIQAMLRIYAGLFSDYVYIEEKRIAALIGLTERDVFEALAALSHSHIVNYIPRRRTPVVTFMTGREQGSDLELGRDIYEDRLKDYKQRIAAVLEYATNHDMCRSAFMQRYFGDTEKDCGICDVCLERKPHPATHDLQERILDILADGRLHAIDEFRLSGFASTEISSTLKRLVAEERVGLAAGKYKLLK